MFVGHGNTVGMDSHLSFTQCVWCLCVWRVLSLQQNRMEGQGDVIVCGAAAGWGGERGGGAGYSHQSSHQKLLWLIRVWREMHPHRHHHPHTPSLPQARRSVARPVASALRPAGAGSLDINQGRMSVRTGWRGLGGC